MQLVEAMIRPVQLVKVDQNLEIRLENNHF